MATNSMKATIDTAGAAKMGKAALQQKQEPQPPKQPETKPEQK